MNHHVFTLSGARLIARCSGTLHWPDQGLLCVSDLHLGKSERMARRGGGLLPPYDTRDTLARLDAELTATDPATVVCLGDSFDDIAAGLALSEDERLWLTRMMAGRDWIWVEGNHDPGPLNLGGRHLSALTRDGLTFRHVATAAQGEVSGHYHPKATLGQVSRPCFLYDGARAIMPAFGTFTGGLSCTDAALRGLMGPGACVVLTGPRCHAFPMFPRRKAG